MKVLAVSLAAVALLAACGGGSSGPPAGAITVKMTDYKFDPGTISAPSGKVVLYLVNAGSLSHDLTVVDAAGKRIGKSDLVQPGNAATFAIENLAVGTYTIYCDVTGHRQSGMEGSIEVT